MASISSVTDLAVPKAEEHSQIDVSAYDVMGRMVLVENNGSSTRHLHGQLHKHYSQFTYH